MSEDFASYPTSIGEAKANRDGATADDWSPRDALIATLRSIDSGEFAPTSIAIVMAIEEPSGVSMEYAHCCPSTLHLIGMYARAMRELDH
jgi:hypothetical protein